MLLSSVHITPACHLLSWYLYKGPEAAAQTLMFYVFVLQCSRPPSALLSAARVHKQRPTMQRSSTKCQASAATSSKHIILGATLQLFEAGASNRIDSTTITS
jgi:hypothetical protein